MYVFLCSLLRMYVAVLPLKFQIDHTVGKNLHGWKKDIDNGARAIYVPTPVDFKTLPVDLRNFLALEQHHRLLLLLWKKNAARKFYRP